MTEEEHKDRIRGIVAELNSAVEDAVKDGIIVNLVLPDMVLEFKRRENGH